MEMVALVILGIFTVAVIQQQRRSMDRLVKVRERKAPVAGRQRRA